MVKHLWLAFKRYDGLVLISGTNIQSKKKYSPFQSSASFVDIFVIYVSCLSYCL